MSYRLLGGLALLGFCLSGCGPQKPAPENASPPGPVSSATREETNMAASGDAAKAAAPYGKPGAVNANATDPEVEKLEAAAAVLQKKLSASPGDAKLKNEVAEAYYKAGYALEYSKAGLPPRARYRGALTHYDKALALNPKHEAAARERQMILDIYKSMGIDPSSLGKS